MNRVVYVSRGGNTKKLADAIAKGAGAPAVSVEHFDPSESVDTLYVGASIYAGAIDGRLRRFLAGLKPSQVKCVVVFGTSAGKKTALPEIKSILEPKGIGVSNDEFHCRGSFLFANRGRPDGEDLRQAEAFAERTCREQK
ncbi:Flavodoxin [Ruminococcaceae bacterium BL-6]|jgi:flavodoxin|nr:Flavodoxin [Ruminococcaceae bacterium BL-6]